MLVIQLKIDYNIKTSEIENKIITDHYHNKYITIQEFNKIRFYCKSQTSKFSKQK